MNLRLKSTASEPVERLGSYTWNTVTRWVGNFGTHSQYYRGPDTHAPSYLAAGTHYSRPISCLLIPCALGIPVTRLPATHKFAPLFHPLIVALNNSTTIQAYCAWYVGSGTVFCESQGVYSTPQWRAPFNPSQSADLTPTRDSPVLITLLPIHQAAICSGLLKPLCHWKAKIYPPTSISRLPIRTRMSTSVTLQESIYVTSI